MKQIGFVMVFIVFSIRDGGMVRHDDFDYRLHIGHSVELGYEMQQSVS